MNSSSNIVPLLMAEFFELAIHNILQVRKLYPDTIFVKKQKYGAVVYKSVHPQLNEYISNSMQAIYCLVKECQLSKVVICFIKSKKILEEKVVFDILSLKHATDKDPFFLEIERIFRAFFLKLHSSSSYLKPLSKDVTFAIQVHTTESAGVEFMENPTHQDFPWAQVSSTYEMPNSEIVPVQTIDTNCINMQIFIEKQ